MRVLSLFDGMSCGQIALRELGITPEVYYASEVDRYAIEQTRLNFPDTVHLGDVRNVDGRSLGRIDLLIGGSPCQSFSFAGRRNGMSTTTSEEVYTLQRYLELKSEGFEFEGQSYLFWEYVRILHEVRESNPDVLFLLENVQMAELWERTLSSALDCPGIHINSALVSAQNRKRIYWTNIGAGRGMFGEIIPGIPQPEDRGIYIRDILEEEVDGKYYLRPEVLHTLEEHAERNRAKGNGFGFSPKGEEEKMNAVLVGSKGIRDLVRITAMRGRGDRGSTEQRLEPRGDGKSNCLTTVQKDNLLIYQRPRGENRGGYHADKSSTLSASAWQENNLVVRLRNSIRQLNPSRESNDGSGQACVREASGIIRRLTPTECARLQTIPEWYRWECSSAQQYKMLGNGWTIEVIKHIFSFLPKERGN